MTKTLCTLVLLLLTPVALVRAASDTPAGTREPVLLELFTSEGCSSCPPADRLLESLDRSQPISGADVIVISEHVDYWNQLGWSDPFSSALYSERQRAYASHLNLPEVYTPQLVIDGHTEFVGSDREKALTSIQEELQSPKIALSVQKLENGSIHIDAPAQPAARKLDVYIVLAADRMQSQVARGENAGHTLSHVSVAYSFKKAGSWNTADALSRDLPVTGTNASDSSRHAATRIIVFLQDPHTLQISGVAQRKPSN